MRGLLHSDVMETTSRTAEQQNTAQRILALAQERFLTEGYSHVSVDALSRALRVSKKTLYEHFSSKEVLLQRAVEAHLDTLRAEIDAAVEGEGTFHSKVEAFLYSVHARLGWIEASALEDMRNNAPRVWDYLFTFRRESVQRSLEALLEEGQREGYLRPDLEVSLVVEMMLASLETLTRPTLLQTHRKSAAEMVAFTVRTVIDGCSK